ncbi:LytTR family transcriptional regulator DNA-binding domain-containing protein, partial [Candidatus Cloacimonadota bacterium]
MGKKLKISKQLNSIIIIDGNTHIFCKINEIVLIKSDKDYIRIYNPEASCLILGTLNRICEELPNYFIRAHKSYIINIKKI